jgi:hypothetical protein
MPTPSPDWILTTDPDRAPHPDPRETLVPLDLAAAADPEEKTRLFQTGLAWYVCAPGLHQPAKTTQDTLYPILLTIAGSAAAIKASRSNFQLGAYGRVHPAGDRVHGGHLRLDLLPPSAFRWHASALTHPVTGQTDQMLTAALAALFERQAGGDAPCVQFAYALPAWRQARLLAELQAQSALCAAILAHAEAFGLLHQSATRTAWPTSAPRWTVEEMLAQVPLALEVLDYVQRRTYRPIPQAAPFRMQCYFAACRQGLFTHARPLAPRPAGADLVRWCDPATPLAAPTAANPTAWAQHPGPLALTIHSAFPPAHRPPVVAAQVAQQDLDAFLLEQVAIAHKLNPALLQSVNPL